MNAPARTGSEYIIAPKPGGWGLIGAWNAEEATVAIVVNKFLFIYSPKV
jgi:hypothetical protein